MFVDIRASTPGDICTKCGHAIRLAPEKFPEDLPTTPLLAGAADWYSFELEAWAIGEAVRQALVGNPKLRKSEMVQECILSVIETRNLRRGRQSFVMCLGFTAAAHHAERLIPLLRDPDVDGQVVDTLLKMKAGSYGREVAPLLRARHAWIRKLARRYVERFPS